MPLLIQFTVGINLNNPKNDRVLKQEIMLLNKIEVS